MEKEITQKLMSVINALENISVSGRKDITNMIGCMSVLDDIAAALAHCKITTDIEPTETKE